jgi:hypothetical protein
MLLRERPEAIQAIRKIPFLESLRERAESFHEAAPLS